MTRPTPKTELRPWTALAVLALLLVGAPAPALASAQFAQTSPGYQSASVQFTPRLELTGLVGWHLAGDIETVRGYFAIDDAMSYGAALDFHARPGYDVELLWIIVPTNMRFVGLGVPSSGQTSLTINYFQVGGVRTMRKDRVELYLGGTFGIAILAPGDLVATGSNVAYTTSDQWSAAFTLGGGLKLWLGERLALRADARFMAPIFFSSTTFYAGYGGGGVGVSGGIPMVEGNFAGGLVLAL